MRDILPLATKRGSKPNPFNPLGTSGTTSSTLDVNSIGSLSGSQYSKEKTQVILRFSTPSRSFISPSLPIRFNVNLVLTPGNQFIASIRMPVSVTNTGFLYFFAQKSE